MPPICTVQCPKCKTEFYFDKVLYEKGPQQEVLCPSCLLRFPWDKGLNLQTLWQTSGKPG